jgi:hypothetical protein
MELQFAADLGEQFVLLLVSRPGHPFEPADEALHGRVVFLK